MILYINTTDLNKITLALVPETGKVIKTVIKIPYHESHKTLEHIERFLHANKIYPPKADMRTKKLSTLNFTPSTIFFCSGPGSFTGIRIAASISQALSFAWSIPLRAIPKEKVPKNLRDLTKLKVGKKLEINYGRPAI